MSRIGNPGCRRSRRFSSPPVRRRQPFKERWLERYIAYDIESFFVAITEVSTVAGYLAGCLDNPAHNPRFADNGYYASFAPLCDPVRAICTLISTNATVIAVLAPL